jgi:hypothetical protein
MLIDKTEGHLDEVLAFAREIGMEDNLMQRGITYLHSYANHDGEKILPLDQHKTRCLLFKDFAPHSFYFVIESNDNEHRRWMNGGLIFHGPHDRGGDGGAPTFSVNINPCNGWSIHT